MRRIFSIGSVVLIEAMFTTDLAGPDGFREPRQIGGVLVAREPGMVQMKRDGAAINKFAVATQMIKPRAKVGIFDAPTGIILIKSVDGDEVFTPERHVAADDAALSGVAPDDRDTPPNSLGRAADFASQHPLPYNDLPRLEFRRKLLAHKTAATVDYTPIDPVTLKLFTGTHPKVIQEWLPKTEGIFCADPNYQLSPREKKHRLMLKLERWFGLRFNKKHDRLVQ